MRQFFKKYRENEDGVTVVSFALSSGFVIILTGAAIEIGMAFWQWNTAQQAARRGARLAAISMPVATDLTTMTGVGGSVSPGDPMPDYVRLCSGDTAVCSNGAYNQLALNALIYGPDQDDVCAKNTRERSGMCDVYKDIKPENVTVEYRGSGLGIAGYPGQPSPIITVRLTGLEYDFVFLDLIAPGKFKTMPDVEISVMSEDLKAGS